MRTRHLLIPALATALVLTGAVARADERPAAPWGPEGAATGPDDTITLPTGDTVTRTPNGTFAIDPAPGRDNVGFLPTTPLDGTEYPVVPVDLAGELLRPQATSAVTTAKDTTTVTITLEDRNGRVPRLATAYYAGTGTDEAVGAIPIDLETGAGTVELPRDDYQILVRMLSGDEGGAEGEFIAAGMSVTVEDEPVELTVDGADAVPIGVEVDRPADLVSQEFRLQWQGDGDNSIAVSAFLSGGFDMYAIPSDEEEDRLSMAYRPNLVNPDGPEAADPYGYTLTFSESGRVPEDLVYEVDDEDLAVGTFTNNSLGEPTPARRCDTGFHETAPASGFCWLVDIALPSTRTEYYTADPQVTYSSSYELVDEDHYGFWVSDLTYDSYEPGPFTQVMGAGPSSLGVSGAQEDAFRWNDTVYFSPSLIENATTGENIATNAVFGTAVLTGEDGTEIGRYEGDVSWLAFEMPTGETGRYKLTIDATTKLPAATVAIGSTVEYEFASGPVEPDTYVPLAYSVVAFDAEGVVDTVAPRDEPQDVTLTYTPQANGPDTSATDITFEVSYDDGTTWTPVVIDRDGDTATATLHHPDDAEWVSVRFTATDDAGNRIAHSTTRSYALG